MKEHDAEKTKKNEANGNNGKSHDDMMMMVAMRKMMMMMMVEALKMNVNMKTKDRKSVV